MKEWNHTFDPVSKAEWLAQIKKDLKETSIDSLQSQWWEGEFIEPFHHPEDVLEKVSLPDEYFANPPLIMEWIDATSYDSLRISNLVNSSLRYGAQCIVFENHDSAFNLNRWLEGVHRDMVEISVDISSASKENIASILQTIPSSVGIRLYRDTDSTPEILDYILAKKKIDNPVQLVYQIPSGKNWINDAVKMFSAILNDFKRDASKEEFLKNCRIKIDAEPSFLKQIVQLRVIQLVWLNIINQSQNQPKILKSPIEYHISGKQTMNPDQFLINAAASSLCASLSGVLAICIHHIHDENIPAYYERINRNIHHLLSLESQAYKGLDPLSGSYAMDFYTAKWTTVILDKLSV